MALTRITSTVVDDNAITADKIANAAITSAMIAAGAITADKLAANTGTEGPSSASINTVSSNVASLQTNLTANINVVSSNVTAITDVTTDLNIGSGKYFFDKSITALGINNVAPRSGTVSLGDPANVILKYSTLGGNVLIGAKDTISPHRLDVRGTANVGALSATTMGSIAKPNALTVDADGKLTLLDDLAVSGNVAITKISTFTQQVTMSDDLIITGNLTVLGETTTVNTGSLIVQDNFIALANSQPFGSVNSLDSGIFFNRGSSGNAALYYDTSAKGFAVSETRDPFSNTTIHPSGAANLVVGGFTTSALTIGATLVTSTAAELNILDGVSVDVSAAEINHLNGVTSAIQTQIDTKIATTASASNDFITFTRLNANVNVVQDNVAALTGGALILKPFSNANTQAAGSTANTFFIGKAMPGNPLSNILMVSLDGVVQTKDVPSGTFASNNDFIVNAVAAHASVKFTRTSIPVGTKVLIQALSVS